MAKKVTLRMARKRKGAGKPMWQVAEDAMLNKTGPRAKLPKKARAFADALVSNRELYIKEMAKNINEQLFSPETPEQRKARESDLSLAAMTTTFKDAALDVSTKRGIHEVAVVLTFQDVATAGRFMDAVRSLQSLPF